MDDQIYDNMIPETIRSTNLDADLKINTKEERKGERESSHCLPR